MRSGRIATLAEFASKVRLAASFPPPTVDLIEAEFALSNGKLELAQILAARSAAELTADDQFQSRALAIMGHAQLLLATYDSAALSFRKAYAAARDERDGSEALNGLAVAKLLGEKQDVAPVIKKLFERRRRSPVDLLRASTAELVRRRLDEGIAGQLEVDEAIHALDHAEDPRARTAFVYNLVYTHALRAEYDTAAQWFTHLQRDVEFFELQFALPYTHWTAALIKLGQRKFGEVERHLQALEDLIPAEQSGGHRVNARILRARLQMQTSRSVEAVTTTAVPLNGPVMASWAAEYLATHALALACAGRVDEGRNLARKSQKLSRGVEVRALAAATEAVAEPALNNVRELVRLSGDLGVWDAILSALRSSPPLATCASSDSDTRPILEMLYSRSGDRALARRAGFRTRATREPEELLSPREIEVLGLIANGMTNSDIARALYISPSTAKVHVRHVLEKLGVRTRAQAVARHYKLFAIERGADRFGAAGP